MADVQEQLDFLLSVDRLISAAEDAKQKGDRLLMIGESVAEPGDKRGAKNRPATEGRDEAQRQETNPIARPRRDPRRCNLPHFRFDEAIGDCP